MPLGRRIKYVRRDFKTGISLEHDNQESKFIDCQNVYFANGLLNTRNGISLFNPSLLTTPAQSLSFFKKTDGDFFIIAKAGTELLSINSSGAATILKTGLIADTKHSGITFNDRHIIATGPDEVFQFDGSALTVFSSNPPAAPTLAVRSSGSLTAATYQVALTYESSVNGFQTNLGAHSSPIVLNGTTEKGINITDIPGVPDNTTIDLVNIYIKNVTTNSSFLFVNQISIPESVSYAIEEATLSTDTPPTTNGKYPSGGALFIAEFNRKIVLAGNEQFCNDIFFSEQDDIESFDSTNSQLILNIPGDGCITGIATGFFNDADLAPYLVVFKKSSSWVYSELSSDSQFTNISRSTGCVSHKTITINNGNVYFLSEKGWKVISNGKMAGDREDIKLSGNDLDEIFIDDGSEFRVNPARILDAFSVQYKTLNHYMTWVCESGSNDFNKAYVYDFGLDVFYPFKFKVNLLAATIGSNSTGSDIVFLSDESGAIYTYSVYEDRIDDNSVDTDQTIEAFALTDWIRGDDNLVTFNFRDVNISALNTSNTLTVKAFVDFDLTDLQSTSFSFLSDLGFTLDVSLLDAGSLGSGKEVIQSKADINRVGRNLCLGFFQDVLGANIGLLSITVEFNTNGNIN